jgi:hypothetical protein
MFLLLMIHTLRHTVTDFMKHDLNEVLKYTDRNLKPLPTLP